MKPRSFRPRSIAATVTCTSGWSECRCSIPSGAAMTAIRLTACAPARFTVSTA